ncbi:DUF721 domain-containing protein [Caldisericum exile]|uniref:DUF721 domain-containing protein n=1 Tax=Caldisericum exile (strain DSM 21853 / NBRC 104410 / AZM16c01) TaxID=511051 RepID=A0A7U6GD39_CALEA|nr:DUF721 domain-containing protein [Caldisericum exile]BAL80131.1 hypothetical protein CSE_00050 [Caldisericum exile AZM16c01]
METIKRGIDDFFERRGLLKKIKGFYPVVKWGEIVGEQLARYTRPLKYQDETIFIGVSSPLFKRELERMKDDLIRMIKEKSGEDTPVKYLNFRLIPFGEEKIKAKKKLKNIVENVEVELDKTDYDWIDSLLLCFKGDDKLKESFRNVLIAYRIAEKKMEKLGYKRCAKCGALFKGRGKLCPVCEIEDKKR